MVSFCKAYLPTLHGYEISANLVRDYINVFVVSPVTNKHVKKFIQIIQTEKSSMCATYRVI